MHVHNFKLNYLDLLRRNSIVILLLFVINSEVKSQRKSDMVYTPIDSKIFDSDASQSHTLNLFFWDSFDYAYYEFSNTLKGTWTNRNKKEQQRIENLQQQTQAKLGIIKSQYLEYKAYPTVISDGWHNAIATDNLNFCKDVKVLVQKNKVKQFVIENYIPLNFTATRDIKNAKNVIALKNFSGEQMNIVDLYFIYDIEEQTIVPEPIKAGFVCFWSDMKNFEDIKITLDGVKMEGFKFRFNSKPECFSDGMICRILRPGTYTFEAVGKGAIDWKRTIEIKENNCLKIRLGR